MELGLLPALGSGLGELRRTGQSSRLIDGYFRPYARAFERVWYFSYLCESLEDYVDDRGLASVVAVRPAQGERARLRRAVEMPVVHRREFGRCGVLRAFQLTGVIPALLARGRWGTPFVTTYGFWYARLSRPGPSRLLKRTLERVGLRRAAAVIVTTAELRRHVATLAAADRVHVIPNGVDLARFTPADRRGSRRGRVLYVGRLSTEKNLSALVEAMAALPARIPAELVMIGDGPLRHTLEALARDAGVRAEFPGVVDHGLLPEWLQRADAFVLPSFTEGHPKALLEAMAAGLACVVSNCAGNRALVSHEQTGLLFDPRDPVALAAELHRVLSDDELAHALGGRARSIVASEYDLARLVGREIDLLKRVARS